MPMVSAGRMDKRIRIEEKKPTTQDDLGQESPTWTIFAECNAEKRDTAGREYWDRDERIGETKTLFRLRWIGGLRYDMRIVLIDGCAAVGEDVIEVIYDIESIRELGRREAIEIVASADRD